MQLLYMDESGVEELLPSNTHFVLLGLMIPADLWKSITEQLESCKRQIRLTGRRNPHRLDVPRIFRAGFGSRL